MATLQIRIRDKKFVSTNGVNLQVATETHVAGNGWCGDIDEKGNIDFYATRFYDGIKHKIKFQIVDGVVKKWLKIGNQPPKVLKHYKLEKWPDNGVIGLSNGILSERVTYFRTSSFQKFLDEYQITAVRCESANGIYNILQEHNGHMIIFSEVIETDGKIKVISRDVDVTETSNEKPFYINEMTEVTDASWVIKTVSRFGEVKHRILYTLDELQEIIGLPKIK